MANVLERAAEDSRTGGGDTASSPSNLNSILAHKLIDYAESLSGGDYGEKTEVHVSGNTISIGLPLNGISQDDQGIKREVCGYVAYLLGVGLTNFPGDSSRDRQVPKVITDKTIDSFKSRTNYLVENH